MNLPHDMLTRLLAKWPVATLATVSSTGQPHLVPVVFCEHAGSIYSPLDGKRKRGTPLKRFTNVSANPKAALLLEHYDRTWQALWWVRIDGEADRFEPTGGDAAEVANRLLAKYPQYQSRSLTFDRTVFLRLRPTRITAWSQVGSTDTIDAALADLK